MTMITAEILAQDVAGFLEFKRALGYSYVRGEFTLRSFERFVQQDGSRERKVELEAMLYSWLSRLDGRKALTVACELGVIRQLCIYRRRHDPCGFVPDREWAPQSLRSNFVPYIFSRDEVILLLDTAPKLHGPNVWAPTLRILLLILYCTGLRPGEAIRLQLRDVELGAGRSFIVRQSKGKTRVVPFRSDLARELRHYMCKRQHIATSADDGALLVRPNGEPLSISAASAIIRRLLRQVGLKPPKGRVGPRPYDMRHAFAVHRLTDWYRKGVDIHARLPWLSAYMGHDNVLGTEVYLTATPELTAIAAERFEQRFRRTRRRR